jgi:hypothetical protein
MPSRTNSTDKELNPAVEIAEEDDPERPMKL